jgi:capsular polysaccharide biosynthesis protein
MDFWQTLLVLFRRWYVALPAFLIAVGAAVGIYITIPVTYTSTAVLVLDQPLAGGSLPALPTDKGTVTNPLLNFDQGLNNAAAIIIQALNTPEVALALGASPTGDPSYKVTNGSTNQQEQIVAGPFVFVEGDSRNAQAAQDIAKRCVERVKQELAGRQKALNAPEQTYITVDVAVQPTTPVAQRGNKTRAAAVAVVMGVVAALCAAYSFESYYQARRRKAGSVHEESLVAASSGA